MIEKIRNENGEPFYEGAVKDGAPYGAGTMYYPDGTIYQEGVFGPKGLLCGREYYPTGKLRFEGLYRYNMGYGPNYPICGRAYNPAGEQIYEGEFQIRRSGLGYPFVVKPEGFGPVPQKGKPRLHKRSEDEENDAG